MRWPHAPAHWLFAPGHYIVTAGTLHKEHLLTTDAHKDLVTTPLFDVAHEFGWTLEAWCILVNHYHFVARSPDDPKTLTPMLKKLHGLTAVRLNQMDRESGRKVWYQCWDTHITFETSYLARLKYVHGNAVHHGLVDSALQYPWCSASWSSQNVPRAFYETVGSFKTDEVNVPDDF